MDMNPEQMENMDVADSLNGLYPQEIWYGLAVFIFIVAVFQWGSILHSKFARRTTPTKAVTDPEKTESSNSSSISLRRIPSAIVNAYRVIAFRWTLEIQLGSTYTLNMAEVFIAVAYIVFLFTWTFINTTDLGGNKLAIMYWSGRAGVVGASQLPLITALGTKNNVVSLVTGIRYEKLVVVHRIMARVVFVLLWTHGSGEICSYAATAAQFGPYLSVTTWIQCGLTAVIAFTVLCVVSLRPVRSASYELFYYAHFILVLIFLIGAYFHVNGAGGDVYWVWPSFVVWALDRVIRVCRLIIFNHSYFGFKSGSGTMDASTELLSDHLVRLRLKRPSHFHWGPGQTAYLIMPSVSNLPFEAHPFTIASIDSSLLSTSTVAQSIEGSVDKADGSVANSDNSTPFWKELVFLVNVREGFTKHLKEVAAKNGKVKVFVDGPYGSSPDLGSYDGSILIAGGSGVSYTLPVLLNIIEHVRNGQSSCRRVVFIWCIRDASHVHWIDGALIKAIQLAPASLAISIQIYVTGAFSSLNEDDSVHTGSQDGAEQEKNTNMLFKLPAVKVHQGRADLNALLKEEVAAASGRMSVSVCGSEVIARDVRHALRFPVSAPSSVLRGGPSVTLYVESFGYS